MFISCNNTLNVINKKRNKLYTQEQLNTEFTKQALEYHDAFRDTIFNQNNLLKIKDFILIEKISSINGHYSGCFISKKLRIGFWKSGFTSRLEYEECDYKENYLNYLANKSAEELKKCSEMSETTSSGIIFYTKYEDEKLIVKETPDFDFKICIK